MKNRKLNYNTKLNLIDDNIFTNLVDEFQKDHPEYNPFEIGFNMANTAINNPTLFEPIPRLSLKRNFKVQITPRPDYKNDCEYAIMTTKSGLITHLIELTHKPESIVGLKVELIHTHLGYIDQEMYSIIYASIWEDNMIGTWKNGKLDIFRLQIIPDFKKVTWSETHNAFVAIDNEFWIKAQVHDLNWDSIPEESFRILVAAVINNEDSAKITLNKEPLGSNIAGILHDRSYPWILTNPGYTKLGFEVCLHGYSGSMTAYLDLAWLDPAHNNNLKEYLSTIKDQETIYRL